MAPSAGRLAVIIGRVITFAWPRQTTDQTENVCGGCHHGNNMPSTRVWVKQGLNSHRSAQVLLVPLGNIPPDVYAKYCEILRRFRCVWECVNGSVPRSGVVDEGGNGRVHFC